MSRIQNFFSLFFIFLIIIQNVRARLSGEGIIGGEIAKDGEYGYHVSLQVGDYSICGGGIISDSYVVTAAHCIISLNNNWERYPSLQVLAGTNFLNSSSPHKVIVDIDEAFVPIEYDRRIRTGYTLGDIAVLKLKQKLDIDGNPNLRKLNLPNEHQNFDWIEATVTGFGWIEVYMEFDSMKNKFVEKGGYSDDKMRYAKASVMSNELCKQFMSGVTSEHLCAAVVQRDPKNHEGVCGGDSGGPLVYDDTIIGVVSGSPTGCAENVDPALYTRISSFVNFIKRIMRGNIDKTMRHFKFVN